MVAMILEVRVARMLALTPLPRSVGQHHDHVLVRPDDLHLVPAELLALFVEALGGHVIIQPPAHVSVPSLRIRFLRVFRVVFGLGNGGLAEQAGRSPGRRSSAFR